MSMEDPGSVLDSRQRRSDSTAITLPCKVMVVQVCILVEGR